MMDRYNTSAMRVASLAAPLQPIAASPETADAQRGLVINGQYAFVAGSVHEPHFGRSMYFYIKSASPEQSIKVCTPLLS